MSRRDGGPAFPAVVPWEYDERQGKSYPNYQEAGMTLRDWFAGQVVGACVASPTPKLAAELAYRIADAMLEARDKT